jgi:hypothetical protein
LREVSPTASELSHGVPSVPAVPEADLPDEVTLSLAEAADVLFAVDLAVEIAAPGTPEHRTAKHAQRLLTRKLWPALGDLLDEDEA